MCFALTNLKQTFRQTVKYCGKLKEIERRPTQIYLGISKNILFYAM